MITMAEIARLTHVSQPTVSRVLNGNQNVDPAIRERVLACAKEHDYQPNALAKGMKGSKTKLLGVLLTDISNSFFAELAKYIELEAKNRGYSIILFNSNYNPNQERDYIDVVRRYRVDGVIAVPIHENSQEWKQNVQKLDVPVVLITRHNLTSDSAYVDHTQAGRMVAKHLVEHRFEQFLFIGQSYDRKFQGFRQELGQLGLCEEHQVSNINYRNGDYEQLKADLQSFLKSVKQRLGIFAYNDLCATQVLHILRELNIRVPEEVGVVGFDDTFISQHLMPSLTTVRQPIQEMAESAVSHLVNKIEHPEENWLLDESFSAELVSRDST